jgi:hypothetical protein
MIFNSILPFNNSNLSRLVFGKIFDGSVSKILFKLSTRHIKILMTNVGLYKTLKRSFKKKKKKPLKDKDLK